MWLKELFERDGVQLPDWLHNGHLDDEWGNATYLKGEAIHKWELNSVFGFRSITLEEDQYTFTAYDEDNNVIFEKVESPEYELIS